MKLALAVASLVALAVASAFAVQQLNRGDQFRALMTSGDQALAAGNSYEAIAAYSGAIALRPDSMAPHLRRGKAYETQRRQDEAIRDYIDAARLLAGQLYRSITLPITIFRLSKLPNGDARRKFLLTRWKVDGVIIWTLMRGLIAPTAA